MTFNAPYQEGVGGGTNIELAVPLYHRFIEDSIDIQPDNMVMLIPSRWMGGGKG